MLLSKEKVEKGFIKILKKMNQPHLDLKSMAMEVLLFMIDLFSADKAMIIIIREDFDPEDVDFSQQVNRLNIIKIMLKLGYSEEEWQLMSETGVSEKNLYTAIKHKTSFIVPDLSLASPNDAKVAEKLNIGSWMSHVLVIQDRAVALINLAKKEKNHYKKEDLEDLTNVSLLLATAVNISNLWERERKLILDTIHSLNTVVEAKDFYTAGHVDRVKHYSEAIALNLGLTEEEQEVIGIAAVLHDVGKVGVSDTVLHKAGPLDREEVDLIRKHVVFTDRILQNIGFLDKARVIACCHHEYLDGTGYSGGLKGYEIPLGSRILAIADAFDAMTSNRSYRKALYLEDVLNVLTDPEIKQWDKRLVNVFIDYLHSDDFKNYAIQKGLIKYITDDKGKKIYDQESILKFKHFSKFFNEE